MSIYKITLLASLVATSIFISCNDDDPVIPNEEELITTMTFTLTPVGGGESVIFKFIDLDGDGGTTPVISTQPLTAQTTYTGTMKLHNEIESPAENITEEVSEEATAHQFFYASSTENLTITYDDEDENGNPVGLETLVETKDEGTGQLTITLRHEPKKPNNGSLSDAGGETDIAVTFEFTIEG